MVMLIAINSISIIVVKNCINIIFTVFGTLQAIFIIYCIYKVGFIVHDLYYIKIKCINNLWCNDTNKLKEVHLNYLLVSRSYYTQIQLLKLMKQLQDINLQCHK